MVAITTDKIGARPTGLTGRYRFRSTWFGRQVIEVEFHWTGMPAYSRHVVTEPRWRDGTSSDLAELRAAGLINGGYYGW